MRSVKACVAFRLRLFFLGSGLCFSFPAEPGFKPFSGRGPRRQPLRFLPSGRGPDGTAPVDPCGHRPETSAPDLPIGSLPTPVRVRARAVSKFLGSPAFKGSGWDRSRRPASGRGGHHRPAKDGGVRPGRQRHRSTAIWRATAPMAFFRAAFVALGLPKTPPISLPARCCAARPPAARPVPPAPGAAARGRVW